MILKNVADPIFFRSAQSFKRQAPAPPVKRQTSAITLTTDHKDPAPKPKPPETVQETPPESIIISQQEPVATQESPQFLFKETMSFQDLRESDTTTPSSRWESSPSPAPSSSATYDSVPPPYSATYELPTVETVERAPSPVLRPSSPQPVAAIAVPTIIPKRCAPPPPARTADVTVPKSAPVLAPYRKAPAPRRPR